MRHAPGEAYTNYDRALDDALKLGNNKSRLGLVGRLSSQMDGGECHRVSAVGLSPTTTANPNSPTGATSAGTGG